MSKEQSLPAGHVESVTLGYHLGFLPLFSTTHFHPHAYERPYTRLGPVYNKNRIPIWADQGLAVPIVKSAITGIVPIHEYATTRLGNEVLPKF